MRDEIINEYFEWLFNLICENRFSSVTSYRKLLTCLHDISFRYSIQKDRNRAEDGIDLRYRFAMTQGYRSSVEWVLDILDGPCSVLEMMIALAIRCEEDIMDDPTMGNRAKQWFWGMVINLGLGPMTDDNFDKRIVDSTIERLLDRDYEPNGKGGLFTVKDCDCDLRTVEIWHQLCWYLDNII